MSSVTCFELLARIDVQHARARQLRIPMPAIFDVTLLRFEVAIDDSEALLKAFGPFEIVGEGPQEVAAHVGAFLDRATHLADISAQEPDAPLIAHLAIYVGLLAI